MSSSASSLGNATRHISRKLNIPLYLFSFPLFPLFPLLFTATHKVSTKERTDRGVSFASYGFSANTNTTNVPAENGNKQE